MLVRDYTIPIENLITEKGVSGSFEFEKRPEGAKLFANLQRGDVLVFSKLDRAFRNTRNALNTLHELKQRGVSVHFIDLGGDVTNDGIGSVIFTILPIVNDSLEYESKGKKSGPYRVHEGSRSLTLDPLLERASKKKVA